MRRLRARSCHLACSVVLFPETCNRVFLMPASIPSWQSPASGQVRRHRIRLWYAPASRRPALQLCSVRSGARTHSPAAFPAPWPMARSLRCIRWPSQSAAVTYQPCCDFRLARRQGSSIISTSLRCRPGREDSRPHLRFDELIEQYSSASPSNFIQFTHFCTLPVLVCLFTPEPENPFAPQMFTKDSQCATSPK